MAKSIRLKEETQARVTAEALRLSTALGVTIRDAQVVDLLVNEALNARELAKKGRTQR